jgi:hypothetical protein
LGRRMTCNDSLVAASPRRAQSASVAPSTSLSLNTCVSSPSPHRSSHAATSAADQFSKGLISAADGERGRVSAPTTTKPAQQRGAAPKRAPWREVRSMAKRRAAAARQPRLSA